MYVPLCTTTERGCTWRRPCTGHHRRRRFDKACWCLVHAGVQLGANNMSAFTVSLLSVTSFRWRTGGGAHRSIHHGPMIGFTVAAAAASIKAAVRRPSKKKSTGKDAIKGARSRMRGTHCSESWR